MVADFSQLRSCFVMLGEHVRDYLSDGVRLASSTRAGHDIADMFSETGSVPITQDSLAGFARTFAMTCQAHQVDDASIRSEGKSLAVLAGCYMLALAAPVSCDLLTRNSLHKSSFWNFDTEHGDASRRILTASAGDQVIATIYESMLDVPVTAESLAGIVLGMRYSRRLIPEVPEHVVDGIELAARGLVLRSEPLPIP